MHEPRRGYGFACLKGIEALNQPDIVVFLDGDYSDLSIRNGSTVDPINQDQADLVIGSRTLGQFGQKCPSTSCKIRKLACNIDDPESFSTIDIPILVRFERSDIHHYNCCNMQDKTWGWTVEMQIKAIQKGLRIIEVPVSYRRRIGKSKISGTISGSIKAGAKIISTILKYSRGGSWRCSLLRTFLMFIMHCCR